MSGSVCAMAKMGQNSLAVVSLHSPPHKLNAQNLCVIGFLVDVVSHGHITTTFIALLGAHRHKQRRRSEAKRQHQE